MKTILTTLCLFLAYTVLQAQPLNVEINADSNSPSLLGKINNDGLSQNSYGKWYKKNKDSYQPKEETIKALKGELSEYTIQLFMGTWCGDSKREVPRFYSVLEASEFPLERLTAIAVSRDSKSYKQSPGGEHEGLNIHRVPTFIIYKNGNEVNRIVESPVETLEQDLLAIIKGDYTPNYHSVTVVNDALEKMGIEKFSKKKKKLLPKLKPELESWYELSTYSHTLFRAGQTKKAIEVAKLNTLLFPDEAGTHLRVAEQLESSGQNLEATKYYQKALLIDPENKKAKDGLAAINRLALSKS